MTKKAVHKKIVGALALAIGLAGAWAPARSQVASATADRIDSLAYPTTFGKDPLFIFYQPDDAPVTGTLSARHPDGDRYDFAWSRFNPVSGNFDPPFQTDPSLSASTVTGLENGGYRVTLSNGAGPDTSFLAWVLVNRLRVSVLKTPDGKIETRWRDCNRLTLNGFVTPDTLTYYDPASGIELSRPVEFRFLWTSDNEEVRIPNDSTILAPNITYSPPIEDTWYILTATDEYGMSGNDSVLYESILTDAEFSVLYYDKFRHEFVSDLQGTWQKPELNDLPGSTGMLDATLTVQFVNKSRNGAEYLWVLLDTLGGIREEVVTYDTTERPEFTYFTADKYYYPTLYSTSEEGCVDSAKLEDGIRVEEADLAIPGVFTPNGDGTNDIWYFKHQSIKSCKITVVDRTGKVVYKEEIEDIYDWGGWDGNVRGSNRRAPEGQYYYVVQATGFDGQEFKDPSIWSQMKIFGGAGTNNRGTGGGTGGSGGTGGTPGTGNGEDQPTGLYTGWLYIFRY